MAQSALSDAPRMSSGEEILDGLRQALAILAANMPARVDVPFNTRASNNSIPSDLTAFIQAHFEMEKASTLVRTHPEFLEPCTQVVNHAITQDPVFNLFLISFLFKIDPKPDYLRLVIHLASDGHLTLEECHQVYWQIRQTLFSSGATPDAESFELVYRFYLTLSNIWKEQLGPHVGAWVPPEERHQNKVVVLTNQLLSELHAPSADTYQNAQVLKALGKDVLLINTADLPSQMRVPLFNPALSNYSEAALGVRQIRYEADSFPFYQCPPTMPEPSEIMKVVNLVRTHNPQFVLSLGGSSPTADLCSLFTTVATIPFGGLVPIAASQALVIPRVIKDADRRLRDGLGFHEDALVTAQYAFAVQEAEAPLSRTSLDIPEDAIAFCVVGTRFDRELTPSFLSILEAAVAQNSHLFFVFAGPIDDTGSLLKERQTLEERCRFLGFRDDVPKILGACDAYLNPPRAGGATSAVAAMAAGIPVLSQPWGDVAEQACREGFYEPWSDAEDIAAFAQRLAEDPDRDGALSAKLKERALACTDRPAMIRGLIDHLENRILHRQTVFKESGLQ